MEDNHVQSHLEEYVTRDSREAGLRALRDAPFMEDIPMECLNGMIQENVLKSGWSVFKDIEFLSKAQRRRLCGARRWIVHLYAGHPGRYELFQLDQSGTVVLELDLQRCVRKDRWDNWITARTVWCSSRAERSKGS